MAQLAGISAAPNIPYQTDVSIYQASANGVINPGDWLAYSSQHVIATNSGHTAYWKNSGAGVALDPNPYYDQWGNIVTASALRFLTQGILLVSANFSGEAKLGVGVYPDATGSGVAAPTGTTGVYATWQTAAVRSFSADPTANASPAPVGTLLFSRNFSNAGTGELFVRLQLMAPDARG